jgi:integrase
MQESLECAPQASRRQPWNKGKLIGAKPPLRLKHVWAIRPKLEVEGRMRDLAMFNLAIDSRLRGCDLVSLKVEDLAPHGQAVDRGTIRQKKIGRPVSFEITEQTREALDTYIEATCRKPGDFLFTGRRGSDRGMTTRQYARLVAAWSSV